VKIYAYLAAILAVIGALWGVHHLGGASCREDAANAARASLEAQNRLLAELDEVKRDRETKTREKIKIIEKSGAACMSEQLPDDVWLLLPRSR
jgi:hypothetical protein